MASTGHRFTQAVQPVQSSLIQKVTALFLYGGPQSESTTELFVLLGDCLEHRSSLLDDHLDIIALRRDDQLAPIRLNDNLSIPLVTGAIMFFGGA